MQQRTLTSLILSTPTDLVTLTAPLPLMAQGKDLKIANT